MKSVLAAALCASVALAGCATNYDVSADTATNQTLRYEQGVATTESDLAQSAVKVTPIGPNQFGQMRYAVAALNKGTKPVNFGFENVSASLVDGKPLKLFDRQELEKQARTRAMWAEVAIAAAGGLSAYAANANAYSTTRASLYTPRGSYHFVARTYDPGLAYAGTAVAGAATGAGIVSVQQSLNDIVANLNGSMLQTTTIDPGMGYGGEVVADRMPRGQGVQKVVFHVALNGETHEFKFNVAAH